MHTVKDILGQTYHQKLSGSQWKDFAASVRTRRGNFCECCRRKDVILQVHHAFYDPNKEPWEHDDDALVVLCEHCHKAFHKELQNFRKYVFKHMTPQSFLILNRALLVAVTQYNPLVFAHAFAEFVGNERLVNDHARAYGLETAKR